MSAREELLAAMEDLWVLLIREDNNYDWTSWFDREEAMDEVGPLIRKIRDGSLPPRDRLEFLFVPTGPLQELATSSGWADEFVRIAALVEDALPAAYGEA